MKPARSVLLATVAALLATASPAFAAARLSPSTTVSGVGTATEPEVAVGASGRTLVVWTVEGTGSQRSTGSIEARLGRAGGRFGSTDTLSTGGSAPVAAVGADSLAAVAWAADSPSGAKVIFLCIAKAGHDFGPRQIVASGSGVGGPAGVEVQPDGRVVVVWNRAAPSSALLGPHVGIDFALVEPSGAQTHGSLGDANGVAGVGLGGLEFGQPELAETDGGTVIVASATPLTLGQTPVNSQPQAATLGAKASTFTAEQTIGTVPDGTTLVDPFTGTGGAVVAFGDELAPLLPGGLFGPPVPAAPVDTPSTGYYQVAGAGPVLALPGDGAQVTAYTLEQIDNPTNGGILSSQLMVSVRPAGAPAYGSPTQISSGPAPPGAPVTASAGDSTVVVWAQSTVAGCRQRIYAAVRPAGGSFGATVPLAPEFTTQSQLCHSSNNTQLAIDGVGRYLVTGWLQGTKVDAATFTAP